MFYSKSRNAWFPPEFRADYEATDTWPDDAVEYPREVFDETVSYRPIDKIMVPDSDGHPVLVDLPPPTAGELQSQVNAEARAYLARTDWYVTRQLETGAPVPDDVLVARSDARARVVD